MSDSSRPFGLSRREHIMDELRRTGSVRVSDLARALGVAELTIRRDIGRLADEGLVTRVHGGATLRSALDTTVPTRATSSAPRFRVGMVVPSLNYYWPQVVVGARAAATEQRVQLVLRGASYAIDDQRRQIASLLDGGGVHGLIVAPENLGPDGHAMLQWLDQLPLPVVLVERQAPAALGLTRLEWVTTDHVFGGELALRHLAARGHRRVGIVTAAQSPTSSQLRRGWLRATSALGVDSPIDVSVSLDRLASTARGDALGTLLDDVRTRECTALLVHSDPQAVLLQQFAADHGWALPEDLAIMAYDDEIAEGADPPLTALRPAKEHVGRRAVETMAARLAEGARRPVERVQIVPQLRERASTRGAPRDA
ncbi:substrate-binding domain-containing protein [Microbacterium karelineae]|uniref:substrate-binding domain-containing protein n=1 Tax=Microbacterium karelineae TaxID=2654283 RepID=UPI0012EAAE19|nr:substrate-binding domain-containing protein [Microbacterium karelineae]